MKLLCWNCRGLGNPMTVRELKQLIIANNPDIIFLCETKMLSNNFTRIRNIWRLDGCLAISSVGYSRGLVMLWKNDIDVVIQNYSSNHIYSIVSMENQKKIRFTGFYGNTDPKSRIKSWNILRMVGRSVKEYWIVVGDFNAIIDEAKKEGGRRKPRATMEKFRDVLEDLALVDLKIDRGWFTWVNNHEGNKLVKERLDRFLMYANAINKFPFIAINIIRQANSDRDAVMLGTIGRKPKADIKDLKLFFKFDVCWSRDTEGKDIIKKSLEKMVKNIRRLTVRIDKLIDGPYAESNTYSLRFVHLKLGYFYNKEEIYWAQRSRIRWLKEGDRNTRFFHVSATRRSK
ncbi:hypothetical protein ES319_D06G140800v1, partial [Gossypium barbadense]